MFFAGRGVEACPSVQDTIVVEMSISGSVGVLCDVRAGRHSGDSWQLRSHHLLLQVKVKRKNKKYVKFNSRPVEDSTSLANMYNFFMGAALRCVLNMN